jgi:SAM-dependent methyltransferase
MDLRQQQKVSSSSYEAIADEYYHSRHITSRNFDDATLSFCRKRRLPLPSNGFTLDLGAGTGCAAKYSGVEPSRIIQADISETMLLTSPRESCLQRIRCDALSLPFSASAFSAVMAFLYDAYNKPELYHEVRRVLRQGGVFVGTLPHFLWGMTLRRLLGYRENTATFLTESGYPLRRDSFLMTENQIEQELRRAGLTMLETHDLYLPRYVVRVSQEILVAASHLELSPYALPIVSLVLARG